MVEDVITDPKRIAQLLASELTGLERGPLAAVGVSDADPDASPSPDGTIAYRVDYRGDDVGRAVMYDDHVALVIADRSMETVAVDGDGISVRASESGTTVAISTGAAVKRAVDVLADLL